MAGDTISTRRALLGAAVGAIGVMAAEAVAAPAAVRAGIDGDVVLGEFNFGESATVIQTLSGDSFRAVTGGTGNTAVYGHADAASGHGVYGVSNGTSTDSVGVWGRVFGGDGHGVRGTAKDGGGTLAGIGVFGEGETGVSAHGVVYGVYGVADSLGTGVTGVCTAGTGVHGLAPNGIGGVFESASGTALKTLGKVVIGAKRSGRVKVAAGKASGYVSVTGVTTGSLVIATLSSARSGVWVRAAVAGTGRVTVHLNKAVGSAIYANYLVLG